VIQEKIKGAKATDEMEIEAERKLKQSDILRDK